MKNFKPMLATNLDFNKIDPNKQYMVSPKLDGIRCLVGSQGVFTRSMKPLPNKYISSWLSSWLGGLLLHRQTWLDGELIVGDPTDPMCYRNTVSAIMSEDVVPSDWSFHVFDMVNEEEMEKVAKLREEDLFHLFGSKRMFLEKHVKITIQCETKGSDIRSMCKLLIEEGYEGAMIKPIDAPYKCGRATPKSMELLKFKAWEDDEATVIGYVQKEKNTNEAKVNELGNTQRSSHKLGMITVDELGSLVVDYKGKQFNIGSGFTEEERKQLWLTKDKLMGKLVKFKYMPYGGYEAPRMPIYLGIRSKLDK